MQSPSTPCSAHSWVALFSLAIPLSAQAEAPSVGRAQAARGFATDFRGGGQTLRWYTVLDGVMGGRSSGSFDVSENGLLFRGVLNTNGGGFASLRTRAADLGLAGASGMRLRVRGDGRTYSLRLYQNDRAGRRGVSYRSEFVAAKGSEWRDVFLPFDSFQPSWRGRTLSLPAVDPALVRGLGILIGDKIDGPFRLEVDRIESYDDETGMDWSERRPVVVFGSSLLDSNVLRQLRSLKAAESGLRERDMVVVRILGDGESRVGSRSLPDDEAAKLRERFGVPEGVFATVLVGKDGTVKRRASLPVSTSALFAQVDSMPMRRAERAKRSAPGNTAPPAASKAPAGTAKRWR